MSPRSGFWHPQADASALVVAGLRTLIESVPSLAVVQTATDLDGAIHAIHAIHPCLCLVDITLLRDGRDGPGASLRELASHAAVIVTADRLSTPDLVTLFRARARGVVLKNQRPGKVLEAIAAVLEDDGHFVDPELTGQLIDMARVGERDAPEPFGLTVQERRVVQLLPRGLTNRQIALELGISPHTVKAHLKHSFPKLGAYDRIHAAEIFEANRQVARRPE